MGARVVMEVVVGVLCWCGGSGQLCGNGFGSWWCRQ